MDVIHTVAEFRQWRAGVRGVVAFAPTMGALHEGHASLIRQAAAMAENDGAAVSSIFVNPTQFGPGEDFTKYPRTLEADLRVLQSAGCRAVFVPAAAEMYGGERDSIGQEAGFTVDPGAMGRVLEGAIRPGHFRGVCTVVLKLLNVVQPTRLLLGQKDYQQQAIVRGMVAALNVPTEVVTCPTVREEDGLAMSSRNRYLSADERGRAIGLWEALNWAAGAYRAGEREGGALATGMRERMERRGIAVQYAVVADARTLELFAGPVQGSAVALVAGKVGATRLIDNLLFD